MDHGGALRRAGAGLNGIGIPAAPAGMLWLEGNNGRNTMLLFKIHDRLMKLREDETGASAVEYAILVGIVGAAIATGAQTFGSGLGNVFSGMLNKLGLS
jgi:pilus assembly protein Flp/PilA